MNSPAHVAVCACTYRRPQGLARLLRGLARQRLDSSTTFTVVIADNEASEETQKYCTGFADGNGLSLVYVPVKERGISQARNACLEHLPANADFIAFIDDDEIPGPEWLAELLAMQAATGADVVYGPVFPLLPEDAPAWLRQGNWFHKPRQWQALADGQEIGFAATCNCLLRRAVLDASGLRFDPSFGLSGGEDKLFFRQLKLRDCRMVWAARAVVHETVPPQRACLGYLLRAEYRLGNVRLPVKLRLEARQGRRLTLAGKALSRSVLKGGGAVAGMVAGLVKGKRGRGQAIQGALRSAENLGVLCSLLGIRNRHYRQPPSG